MTEPADEGSAIELDIVREGEERDGADTERRTVKRRYLSTAEAASLIVNKMIGTGIFTTPGFVLALMQDKRLALVLWICGCLYAALSLFVYLDYSIALPYNGAELVYLSRIYHSAKRFRLLPPVLYASYFISLYHTAGNALSFTRFVLISGIDSDELDYHLSGALVKGLAILVLALICLLLWILPTAGLVLNRLLAVFKLVLLIVLGSWGIRARHTASDGMGSSREDWDNKQAAGDHSIISRLAGFIYVVYSYGGWESACYVTGEFDKRNAHWKPKIRWGAIVAVLLVGTAYTVFVLGFFLSCTYDDIILNSSQGDLGVANVFIDRVLHPKAATAIKICIALSGFGNLISVIYTSTKVKQAIALHYFLPFSKFLGSDYPFNAPGGALLLHWMISSIWIISVPPNRDGYAFLIGLLTYGQLIAAGFVGIGRFKLEKRAKMEDPSWKPWIPSSILNYGAGFLLCLINVFVCIFSVWPVRDQVTQSSDQSSSLNDAIPTYYWAVAVGACLFGGFVYWIILYGLQHSLGDWVGWKFSIENVDQGSGLDQERRRIRRDGTRERYVPGSLQKDGLADKALRALKWFKKALKKVL